jgi:NAD(P) transhydrogenase
VLDERFDMVVVGAGPAGEKAAAQAAYFGKSVAVVEQAAALGGAMAASAVTTNLTPKHPIAHRVARIR